MRSVSAPAAVLAALVLLAPPAAAETLVFAFPDHDPVTLSEPWIEQGLELVVAPLAGAASCVVVSRWGLSMAQASLLIDLRPLVDVRSADVEVVTTSGFTTVELRGDDGLIDAAENLDQLHVEILTVEAGDQAARYLQVGGTNLRVISIAIRHGAVPVGPSSWGDLKRLFR